VTKDAPEPPKKRRSAELIVNLDELASICSVTPETMRTHLAGAPAEADWIVQRGRRGVGYKLKAEGAVAWWKSRGAADDAGEDEHRRKLAELRMQMLGGDSAEDTLTLSGKQRYEEFRAGEAELAYRQAIGELVRVADLEPELVNAVIDLRRNLQAIGRTIRRKFQLSKAVELAIDKLIGGLLEEFARKLDVDHDPAGAGEQPASPAGDPEPADEAGEDAPVVRKRPRARRARVQRDPVPGKDNAGGGGKPAPRPKKPRRVQRPVEG
jgi:hypothetical protein